MPTATQQHRPVKVFTALDDDVLLFGSMSGTERLSTLFDYTLTLVSERDDIDPASLLGTDLTVELELTAGGVRHFHGHVADFGDAPREEGDLYAYSLTLRPWMWFLTRTADCRIFQDMSVPDIVREITGDAGFTDIDDELTESFPPWNYCVQYRETDYAFVARLLEQEGIHYYFRHERGRHALVLADGGSGHETVPNYADVPLLPPDSIERRERDHLVEWRVGRYFHTGRFAVGDFNFETPSANLVAERWGSVEHVRADFEVFDYPGEHTDKAQGDTRAKVLLDAADSRREIARGHGTARGLQAGSRFALSGSPRASDNDEYLVVASTCTFAFDNFRSSGGDGGMTFGCDVEATAAHAPWRPARTTPRPIVRGPQTAIVVGPSGEEIWTDRFGRVKLQFHWDRYGGADENSSCWVRVSQLWAGKGWGAMHVPRIGHEVIVEFLEGDPDRPIVTGRVYNGENAVPHPLPASATQSGIKSRSSKGGSAANFNEIRMEDKKGAEQLYVHAEKDQVNVVENDESTSVGHDRSESIGNDERIEIGNDRTESVGRNETITIGSARRETVGADEDVSIGGSRSVTIARNKAETVGVNKAEVIGVAKELGIGGTYAVVVGGDVGEKFGADQSTAVAGGHTRTVGADQGLTVGKNRSVSVGDDLVVVAGKTITLTAGESISIVTGKASITLKKDGTVDIRGADITVEGSGQVDVKSKKNVVVKGRKILQN